jgi:hypothetical protein
MCVERTWSFCRGGPRYAVTKAHRSLVAGVPIPVRREGRHYWCRVSRGRLVVLVQETAVFFFGYSLTLRPLITGGVSLRQAARVAFAADTVSIAVMEIVDNGFVLLVPGAMEGARGPSLLAEPRRRLFHAFWAAFPVNQH